MGLSVQEKKFEIDFQDGNCGSLLVFPIGTIVAIFDLQVTLAKKGKIDFQDSSHRSHLEFQIRMILAIFYLQVNPMLPTKF